MVLRAILLRRSRSLSRSSLHISSPGARRGKQQQANTPGEPGFGMWTRWPWLMLSSRVSSFRGWRQEFNHCILLSLKQVHSDILVKDEICLERVISSYTEAEPFQFPSTASFIIRWLIFISGADMGVIPLNSGKHPPLTPEHGVRMGLCCWLVCAISTGQICGIVSSCRVLELLMVKVGNIL